MFLITIKIFAWNYSVQPYIESMSSLENRFGRSSKEKKANKQV